MHPSALQHCTGELPLHVHTSTSPKITGLRKLCSHVDTSILLRCTRLSLARAHVVPSHVRPSTTETCTLHSADTCSPLLDMLMPSTPADTFWPPARRSLYLCAYAYMCNVQCPRQRMHACVCLARDKKKKTLGAQIGSSLNRNLRKFSLSHCYHRNRLTPIALLRKPAESHRVAKEYRCTMVLKQPVVPVSSDFLSHEPGS